MKNTQKLTLISLIIIAVALPIAGWLAGKNQDNRNRAAGESVCAYDTVFQKQVCFVPTATPLVRSTATPYPTLTPRPTLAMSPTPTTCVGNQCLASPTLANNPNCTATYCLNISPTPTKISTCSKTSCPVPTKKGCIPKNRATKDPWNCCSHTGIKLPYDGGLYLCQ